MINNKKIMILSVIIVILACFSAGAGLFYSNGGTPKNVVNIYGEVVQLFGDGVYANNSMLKATIAKGSDLVILVISLGLLVTTLKRDQSPQIKLLHAGLLVSILYYSVTTGFGVTYSKMFLIYLLLFSFSFFAFVFALIDLNNTIEPVPAVRKFTGTAIYIMLTGSTVLVWLMSILPTIFSDTPLDIIGISTTEPTFIIDIGLIFPTCLLAGILLLQKKTIGYILTSIMLTFSGIIAVIVVGQTAVQFYYQVVISVEQIIGYVGTFIVFGMISAAVNVHLLSQCRNINRSAIKVMIHPRS